jgi:hypothetical protein
MWLRIKEDQLPKEVSNILLHSLSVMSHFVSLIEHIASPYLSSVLKHFPGDIIDMSRVQLVRAEVCMDRVSGECLTAPLYEAEKTFSKSSRESAKSSTSPSRKQVMPRAVAAVPRVRGSAVGSSMSGVRKDLRLFKTYSSSEEPIWTHKTPTRLAAAICSSTLPRFRHRSIVSVMVIRLQSYMTINCMHTIIITIYRVRHML